MAPKDSGFRLHRYFVYITIDASSITQNGCNGHLYSAGTSFVFSDDVCATKQIT